MIIFLGSEPVNGIDDIHRRLSRDSIGRRPAAALLRNWTERLEKEIVPG